MNNMKPVTNIFKGIALIILDVITFLLVFSIWSIVNISLFPWAFIIILFSLILVHIVVLLSYELIRTVGVGSYFSLILITGFYYAIVMIYTGVTYAVTSQRIYIISILIITLIYVVIIAGLYLSGVYHKADLMRQSGEQKKVMDINLQIMNIHSAINNAKTYLVKDKYDTIVIDFESMKERLTCSTPFGRISKSVVMEVEEQLNTKLLQLNEEILSLDKNGNNQNAYDDIIKDLLEIKILTMNREKLIIQ